MILLLCMLSLLIVARSHMQLNYPPAFNSSNNPHTSGAPDPFLFYPYNCCGRTTVFPCGGYLNLLGKPEGAPVTSWVVGSKQKFTLTGLGNHYGGSCQVGFSVDKGKTFQVATSFEGNCPHRNGGLDPSGQTFEFDVPADMPTGQAVFAWTWMNREQEFFMNCAAVTIAKKDSKSSSSTGPASNAAPSYDMDGCTCTCASAFALDAANQYTTGGCDCDCSKAPSAPKPGAIHKRAVLIPAINKRITPAYLMSDCACTCAQAAKKNTNGHYSMSDCTCTCNESPTAAGSKHKRFGSIVRSHFRSLVTKHNLEHDLERDVDVVHVEERSTVAYKDRPSMFFADINNGCESPLTTAELKYPKPGPDVVPGDGVYPLALPSPASECGV
ncbi:hypothetical protein NA57DRAFT_70584 [Rhizodiscina lignyota]|uniref:Lytic polysaccharide monooxygenase n=1 Tax=Rhizodiscina lignyota TaxID=1504668 RepID=A0A9P4IQQ9_9PEZI|nr:hypothetical protein NA57DRAFT_70584 [Rhizodiscina lignyota]